MRLETDSVRYPPDIQYGGSKLDIFGHFMNGGWQAVGLSVQHLEHNFDNFDSFH